MLRHHKFIVSYAIRWWDTCRIRFTLQELTFSQWPAWLLAVEQWHSTVGICPIAVVFQFDPRVIPYPYCPLLFKRDRNQLSRGEDSRCRKYIQLLLILCSSESHHLTSVEEVILNFLWDFLRKTFSVLRELYLQMDCSVSPPTQLGFLLMLVFGSFQWSS